MKDVVLLVTGTRRNISHTDQRKVAAAIDETLKMLDVATVRLLVGDCPTGVDDFVRWYFDQIRYRARHPNAYTLHVYKADWRAHGSAAGPRRNQQMVDDGLTLKRLIGNELVCLAFPSPDSRGTHDCARRARESGYDVTVIPLCVTDKPPESPHTSASSPPAGPPRTDL